MEIKKHFKMYKSGKQWCVAALATLAITTGGILKCFFISIFSSVYSQRNYKTRIILTFIELKINPFQNNYYK